MPFISSGLERWGEGAKLRVMGEVRKQEFFFLLQLYGSLFTVFPGDGAEFGASVSGWHCPWKGRPDVTGAEVVLALKMKSPHSVGPVALALGKG